MIRFFSHHPTHSPVHPLGICLALTVFAFILPDSHAAKGADPYYKEGPRFNPAPDSRKGGWEIQNFGPVGIGITLGKGMEMSISNIEKGSPAEQTGKLKKGQVIESINGVTLKDRDPREILGDIITAAEAKDGRVEFQIKGAGAVVVTIPVMGSYSATWPENCEKSGKIVRNLADLLVREGNNQWGAALFLLSTGDEQDLKVVEAWMQEMKGISRSAWGIGYEGPAVCEYYLRTGDKSVLPKIQEAADFLRDHQYNGAWAGRGMGSFVYQSGGHMNAAGVHCVTFLLLAKACGVEVDARTLETSLRHFYRYSGRGGVPYGDYTPKVGYTDGNGKTEGLAFAMAAATRLEPNGKDSIYDRASTVNGMKAYYGMNAYNVGHTGGGIGEIWKSTSMGLIKDKRPSHYRQYMDARRCLMELSRRYNGGIGIGGGSESNYDKAQGEGKNPWGNYFALSYTIPRRKLFILGAPSKYAVSHTLPVRPWGVAADDDFSSPLPVPGGPLTESDILGELADKATGGPINALLDRPGVSREVILTCLHHPEITTRSQAIEAAVREKHDDILLAMLRSKDARQRHIAVMGLHELGGTWRKTLADPDRITPAMKQEIENMILNPQESWFVKQWAAGLLARYCDMESIKRCRSALLDMLKQDEYWLQGAAITALAPLMADEDHYKIVLPPVVEVVKQAKSYPMVTGNGLAAGLKEASPAIQSYALDLLKPAFLDLDSNLMGTTGRSAIPGAGAIKKKGLSVALSELPGGAEFVRSQPKRTAAWMRTKNEKDLFVFDGNFIENRRLHGTWTKVDHKAFQTPESIIAFLEDWLKKTRAPSQHKMKYGIKVDSNTKVKSLEFQSQAYPRAMVYSGNMIFPVVEDIAYRYKVLTVGSVDFLLLENPFDREPKEGEEEAEAKPYETTFSAYVRTAGEKKK